MTVEIKGKVFTAEPLTDGLWTLKGARGASYVACPNLGTPGTLFLVSERSRTIHPMGQDVRLAERDGTLVVA